jgi:hypothetical protein
MTPDQLDVAACRPAAGLPAQLWDDRLDRRETPYRRGVRHGVAISVCASCLVRATCLDEARPGDGIRGGELFEDVTP